MQKGVAKAKCKVCGIILSIPRPMPTVKNSDESGKKMSKAYSLASATFSDDMKKCNGCRDRNVIMKDRCVVCSKYIGGKDRRSRFIVRGNFCVGCHAIANRKGYQILAGITDEWND